MCFWVNNAFKDVDVISLQSKLIKFQLHHLYVLHIIHARGTAAHTHAS